MGKAGTTLTFLLGRGDLEVLPVFTIMLKCISVGAQRRRLLSVLVFQKYSANSTLNTLKNEGLIYQPNGRGTAWLATVDVSAENSVNEDNHANESLITADLLRLSKLAVLPKKTVGMAQLKKMPLLMRLFCMRIETVRISILLMKLLY